MILAIDLAKARSLFCWYDVVKGSHRMKTIPSTPQAFHDALTEEKVERVIIEVCDMAGWIKDLCDNAHGQSVFARISKGQKTRRKQAAVALARRILGWCWAMLRDGTDWRDPQAAHSPAAT